MKRIARSGTTVRTLLPGWPEGINVTQPALVCRHGRPKTQGSGREPKGARRNDQGVKGSLQVGANVLVCRHRPMTFRQACKLDCAATALHLNYKNMQVSHRQHKDAHTRQGPRYSTSTMWFPPKGTRPPRCTVLQQQAMHTPLYG